MPGEPGGPVVTNSCVFYFTHEAAGAAGTRHSPRPPWRRVVEAQLGRIAPRERGRVFGIGCLKSSRSSSPAKAGDPVLRDVRDRTEKLRRTGYPAGACHRARRRRDPVAGYDGSLWRRERAHHLSNTHRDKFCNSNFSAVAANTCILPCRSALAVSSVMTEACGPATAMQLWPAASP